MADLKIQGEVSVTTSNAEAAFDRLGNKAGQMSVDMAKAGEKAGKAVDQIGEMAKASGEKFTRAESSIVASIKRLAVEAAKAKDITEKLGNVEFNIAAKGLDASKFTPMLSVVRQLQSEYAKLGMAQTTAQASGTRFGAGMQNTAYQLQDFVVQVNGGTDAMRALSMQLPQMLVGFGALGAGIGVLAALLPNVVSLFSDSGKETKKFSDALSDFDSSLGEVGRTVKKFDMEGLYEQFNNSSDAVRAATIEQIKFQQEYIKTAQLVAEQSFAKSIETLGSGTVLERLKWTFRAGGGNEKFFFGIEKESAKLAEQLGLTVEVAEQMLPVFSKLGTETGDIGKAFDQFGVALLQGNPRAVELAKSLADMAKSQRDAAAASSALIEAQDKMSKGHVTTKKEADAAAKAIKGSADAYAALMDRLSGKASGLDASYWKDLETLHKQFQKTGDIDAYRDAVDRLTRSQKFFADGEKEAANAEKLWADAAKAAAKEREKSLESLESKAQAMEDEVRYYGLTESAIQQTIIARLEERRALEASTDSNEEAVAALDREIEARKRLAAAAASRDVLDANAEAIKQQSKDWEKFSDDINKSLTDSLYRAFESGESFGEAFVKSLQNTLKTTVLKIAVQAIVDPITGGIKSALGIGGSAGNALSGVSGLSSAWSAFSGGTTATLGGLIGGEFGAGMAGAYLAPGLAGPTTLGASGAMGAGATLGSALPWIGGALAVASLLGAFDSGGGPKTEGGLVGTIGGSINELSSTGQKFYTGNGSDDYVRQYLTPLMADLDKLAKELGGNASGLEIGLGFNSDPQGKAGDSVGGGVYKDGQQAYFHAFGGYARGSYATELATESKRVMLAALESIDLNDLADAYLDTLDIAGLSDEMASQALALVATTDDIVAAFEKVGFSASDVTLDLINAMGGFDAAGQAVSAMSQALDQIAQSAASSTAMFQSSIRDIELSVLDNPGKYNYLDAEAARYRDVLASLSDPAMIAEYAGRLNNTIMQSWGLLDAGQQQAKSAEFISLLREADTLALSRYDVAKENVTAQAEAIAAAVKVAVAEAMAANVEASNAVATAVNNGIDANINVTVNVPGMDEVSMGQYN